MTPMDVYHHRILVAADRVAAAVRTEDRDVVAAEIGAAVALQVPPGGPDPWVALVTALAVQVDTGVPWRERFRWTLDIGDDEPADPRGCAA